MTGLETQSWHYISSIREAAANGSLADIYPYLRNSEAKVARLLRKAMFREARDKLTAPLQLGCGSIDRVTYERQYWKSEEESFSIRTGASNCGDLVLVLKERDNFRAGLSDLLMWEHKRL